MSKPLPPVKPPEKLPVVYHLTIVKDPDRQSGWFNTVITAMQGSNVLRRTVMDPAEPSMDHALAEFNRIATRIYYFGEGEDLCGL